MVHPKCGITQQQAWVLNSDFGPILPHFRDRAFVQFFQHPTPIVAKI